MDISSLEVGTPLLREQGAGYLSLDRQAAAPNVEAFRLPLTGLPAFVIVSSPNIASGGEATTTYGVDAPFGKTSSDFTTGRRWDDENGLDSLTIAADDWTKLGWAVVPNATSGQYRFRIVANGLPLDTYTADPRWTIGTLPGPPRGARINVRHEVGLTLPAGFMEPLDVRGLRPWMRVVPTGPLVMARVAGAWVQKPVKARIAGAWVVKPLKARVSGSWN